MAISKERLEQLLEQDAIIYIANKETKRAKSYRLRRGYDVVDNGMLCSITIDGVDEYCNFEVSLDSLYETQAEAQWHADNDAERTEYFRPPMELNLPYKFYAKGIGECHITLSKYGKYSVHNMYEKNKHLTKIFDTYPEAVNYARKLFKGEV